MTDYQEFEHRTLTDFMRLPVIRYEDYATVVLAYYKGKKEFPVRLVGFRGNVKGTDFQIREHAFHYWSELNKEIGKIKE